MSKLSADLRFQSPTKTCKCRLFGATYPLDDTPYERHSRTRTAATIVCFLIWKLVKVSCHLHNQGDGCISAFKKATSPAARKSPRLKPAGLRSCAAFYVGVNARDLRYYT